MKWTILYHYHDKPWHLRSLCESNPDSQIIPLYLKHNYPKHIAWRNPDRLIRNCIKENDTLNQILCENVLLLEHDVCVNMNLPMLNFQSMMTKFTFDQNSGPDWCWWSEIPRMPESLQPHAIAAGFFGVVAIKKHLLEKISEPEYDDVFDLDIQSELRFPTIIKSFGNIIEKLPESLSENIHCGMCSDLLLDNIKQKPDLKGILHPIKDYIE